MMKKATILYFIAGVMPTAEDVAAAAKLEQYANVRFRNAGFVPDEPHSLEMCDGVAGAVPKLYGARFPSAEKAIEEKAAQFKELQEKVGDEVAPKSPKKADQPAAKTGAQKSTAEWKPNA